MRIDAAGIHYRELNEKIHAALAGGFKEITLKNVSGQRYIGAGLNSGVRISVHGIPGNDLGVFMDGTEIVVSGNAQDGAGNTMNSGKIVIHGDAGDILGYSMRGGKIFVRGSVGYRAGIHMKAYGDHFPVVVIGGTAADYLGEYMAGGILVVLGLGCSGSSAVGEFVGTGMHGGTIYCRGKLEPHQVGAEVGIEEPLEQDCGILSGVLEEFRKDLRLEGIDLRCNDFVKLHPQTSRPYGRLSSQHAVAPRISIKQSHYCTFIRGDSLGPIWCFAGTNHISQRKTPRNGTIRCLHLHNTIFSTPTS